jgi:hypothetical protein
MSLSAAIDLLRKCGDLEQLAAVWKTNAAGWSRKFTGDEAGELIRTKDELKAKLSIPEPSDLGKACDELLQAYPSMGYRDNQNRWVALCSIPGWRDELKDLQKYFIRAYETGSDCYLEFEALRIHWQDGLAHTTK